MFLETSDPGRCNAPPAISNHHHSSQVIVEFTCVHTFNLTVTLERHYFTDEEIEPWKGSTPHTSLCANSSQASP